MDPLNQQLKNTFVFEIADLKANRTGRLSKRQQSLLASASSTSRLAMLVFIMVMLGSIGIIVFTTIQSPSNPTVSGSQDNGTLLTLGITSAAVLVVIIIGFVISRGYMVALSNKEISIAKGTAQITSNRENNWQVKIGATKLRMSANWQLAAFQNGVEYKVYYLAGPRPNILSAEAIGPDGAELNLDNLAETESHQDQATITQASKGANWVIIVLGVLALQIPIVGIFASHMPDTLRCLVFIGLLVEATGFIWFAYWRLSARSK